jgi:aldose 1-epimerase
MSVPVEYSASWVPMPGSDLSAVELVSPAADDEVLLRALWVPEAGAVGCSLQHRGVEVLGMRAGLAAYLSDAKTFGIPLLAPWANRLGGDTYEVDGRQVDVEGVPGVHRDGNGLPIHGLLSAASGWQVDLLTATDETARLDMSLQFDSSRPEYPAFPFAHELSISVELQGPSMAITTAVTATGDSAVPIAFGWHPYFHLAGVPRQQWQVSLPFTSHLELDSRSLPTGVIDAVPAYRGPLGDMTYDDLYADVDPGTEAWVQGGGRRVSLTYTSGYDYAVVYAPDGDDLIAIEPMTAPTNPFSGDFDVQYAAPGGRYMATYEISVIEVEGDDD